MSKELINKIRSTCNSILAKEDISKVEGRDAYDRVTDNKVIHEIFIQDNENLVYFGLTRNICIEAYHTLSAIDPIIDHIDPEQDLQDYQLLDKYRGSSSTQEKVLMQPGDIEISFYGGNKIQTATPTSLPNEERFAALLMGENCLIRYSYLPYGHREDAYGIMLPTKADLQALLTQLQEIL